MFMKMRRARFFAQFILSGQSEILRCAQDDSEGLRMTVGERFSAACLTAVSRFNSLPFSADSWRVTDKVKTPA
jgi:hypothetical protein